MEITPELQEKFRVAAEELKKQHTPLPGFRCHDDGGLVIRKVSSYFRGRYYYSMPHCEKCDRLYLYAENAPTRGEREFDAMLCRPFTI